MAVVTRRNKAIYLIGSEESEIRGSRLPSIRQVLASFFYHHNTLKKTIRESSRAVIRVVAVFWSKARIPMRGEGRAIDQLEKLHTTWLLFKKSSKIETDIQRSKEKTITDTFNN